MKKIIIIVLVIIGFASFLIGPVMSNVEQPKYTIEYKERNIQIRLYEPVIVAEVSVEGNREEAIGMGFRILADYIFGNNTSKQKIAMTSPVKEQKSEKIAMTSPVTQQMENNLWNIQFVMPSEYSVNSLPIPNNKNIKIKKIDSSNFVVIKFNGKNEKKNISKHEHKLMEFIKKKKLLSKGAPVYAFYNPPWTLPVLRRNEIMIEINK